MRRAIPEAVLVLVVGWAWTLGCNETTVPPPQTVTVPTCPEGSAFDSAKGFCVAGLTPTIATATPGTVGRVGPGATAPTTIVTNPTVPPAAADAGALSGVQIVSRVQPPNTNAVVSCDFPGAWISLLPVAAYPRDDQFLMQSLIGLTQDPKFWKSADPAYAKLAPHAAQRCTASGTGFAVPAGDYWVLAGQEGTFSAKGKYDKNGVKRKVTVPAAPGALTTALHTADLVHTWLCISCPWVEIEGLAPFVVLRHRSSVERRGTDVIKLTHVPVHEGRVRVRVSEREPETTFLDALVLRVGGRTLVPTRGGDRSPLAAADGAPVVIERGGAITVEYAVPAELVSADGAVDLEIVATGHYEPHATP
jgi:hypothetical protein